jgi:hypothetical protein
VIPSGRLSYPLIWLVRTDPPSFHVITFAGRTGLVTGTPIPAKEYLACPSRAGRRHMRSGDSIVLAALLGAVQELDGKLAQFSSALDDYATVVSSSAVRW